MKIFHKILVAASISSLLPLLLIGLFSVQFERHHIDKNVKRLRDVSAAVIEERYSKTRKPLIDVSFNVVSGDVIGVLSYDMKNVYSSLMLKDAADVINAGIQKRYIDGEAYKGVCWVDPTSAAVGHCRFIKLTALQDDVASFVNILIAISITSGVLILIAVYLVSRHLARPLELLIDYIGTLKKGEQRFLLNSDAEDEVGMLVDKLREYSDSASLFQSQLARQERDVAIGRISSHIAHDMRSPLSVLKTYAGLKIPDCEDPDVENLRQSAERSVGKLEHMAEDLVDYAKASKLERARHQLSSVIYEGAISEAKKKAEEKGVKISSAIQGGIFVNVDAYKMERVITNLLSNAVQAIENGDGEVSISAITEHNGILKIIVKDNGKGIEPEAMAHIFDSFFTKGKKGGSGLGLAYCKQVIEAHGGTIDVESELGKGATFTIRIPNCAVEHQDQIITARDSSTTVGMTGRNILIADDDPEIRRQWEQIIPEHGGTVVHSAKTVGEVEDAELDYSKIDTAIVDYQFYGEGKTGIDLIKHLKAKGVKTVYLCTGFYDNEVIIKQAQAAGVERILPKPIDVNCLS